MRPEVGGAISALRFRGVDILRPMSPSSSDPLGASCFPLVPYCNRLREGRFGWNGRQTSLSLNFLPELNSLHGLGWQSVWKNDIISIPQVNLRWGHSGQDLWISPFEAVQEIVLDDGGCWVTLSVTNTGSETIPMGLGLHPYFRRRPETRVTFAAETVMLNDAATMPTGIEAPADHFGSFGTGSTLPGETIDNCYRDWAGTVTIEDDLGSITMSATGAPHLHLYAPAGGSALCCEPVSHTPDALNRAPKEMIALPAGETASLSMRIEAKLD